MTKKYHAPKCIVIRAGRVSHHFMCPTCLPPLLDADNKEICDELIPVVNSDREAKDMGWWRTRDKRFCPPDEECVWVCPECVQKERRRMRKRFPDYTPPERNHMKNQDIETRGRPRNKDFEEFCDLLERELPPFRKHALKGEAFGSGGTLLDGTKHTYLNFRNSASLNALKKKLTEEGFKVSVYYIGTVCLKVRKV